MNMYICAIEYVKTSFSKQGADVSMRAALVRDGQADMPIYHSRPNGNLPSSSGISSTWLLALVRHVYVRI